MKKTIYVLVVCLFLLGCGTPVIEDECETCVPCNIEEHCIKGCIGGTMYNGEEFVLIENEQDVLDELTACKIYCSVYIKEFE